MSSSEVKYIEVATCEALDCLIEFAHFMDTHPKDFGQVMWLENFENCVKSCDEQTKAVQQGERIVCVLSHDKQMWEPGQHGCVDLFALPLDIVYCRGTTEPDDLEPVFPVDKMMQRNESPRQEIWAELKDEDILVILSYSTEGQDYDVRGEAEYIINQFRYALSIKEEEVLRIGPEEDEFLFQKPYKERVENARIIWIYNTPKGLVTNYLRDLPSTRNLIFHYIGPVEKDALNPGRKYGGPIRAMKLKHSLDLLSGSRIVKLFYVSPHYYDSDSHKVLLVHALRSFGHDLLRAAPQLADLVWFRWSLDEKAVRIMTERFYNELLVKPPYCTSQALLAAKSTAYDEWKSDSERYYAWAAPTLITQREHDAERAVADNSIDPVGAALRDGLRILVELT